MIKSAIKIALADLNSKKKPERIELTYNAVGGLQAISWLYETKDGGLYQMAKRRGGVWDREAGGWTFGDPSVTKGFLDAIIKRNPDWPVIGCPDRPFLPLNRVHISHLPLKSGLGACLVPVPLPYFSRIPDVPGTLHVFQLRSGGNNREEVGLLIGSAGDIAAVADSMVKQGAICTDTLAKKWPLNLGASKLNVKTNGWAVQVQCDLSRPLHLLAAPGQKYRWEGRYPYGIRVAIPWDGSIRTTRKLWPVVAARISKAGLEWEGDDPASEMSLPAIFDTNKVAGWARPAPNGYLLHAYQKEGAAFCAKRGMRALIGDEMGVGKTVQAIAAAEATSARRIVVNGQF